ncbi:saccharopine dehydrogenase NADP-binding domain-containing protein [Streptomyces sp. NBC_00555]|uniref:saccharopine dehydrogenase family protein n=1 Tax=Streptomyces sp. NBC_00555 TaxID=2903662 RepID=UPI0022527CA5|nr:saccharopine dehydrogenase family protein [Streptomyces sp. NBC_00555]MCX5011184.1 saccharopine dehydrogenase NADP-binding domain-containing protein [Streptomyces sp. NBC_00555]
MPTDRISPAPVPASGTVHWIGTGLSTGRSGLGLLCAQADRVVLWDRTAERAADRLAALDLTGRAGVRALTDGALEAEVGAGDVIVSMLPAAEHPRLLRLAIDRRAHFACTSYVSEEIAELAERAAEVGVVVLTEAGLDPGIDHLMAHLLVSRAREAIGDTAESVDFTSYCGGIPAVPNEFRYRFSWAPYGVLAALGSAARHIAGGVESTAQRPWEATAAYRLGAEDFEVYPNRDSVPFVSQYAIPEGWPLRTFVRGTLRNAGWRDAWEPVFRVVGSGDQAEVRRLAKELAERHPTTEADRDRVVLSVALDVRASDGKRWQGSYLMDLTGERSESAMARAVSLPVAYGVTRLLAGALPPGLHRAGQSGEEAAPWMAFLDSNGLGSAFAETVPTPRGADA